MCLRPSFIPCASPLRVPQPSRVTRRCTRTPPKSCLPDPSAYRRNGRRRVRVPRRQTSHSPGWEWRGSRKRQWPSFFAVDEAVRKALDALLGRGGKESPLLARVTALGFAVLRSVTEALERSLYPDTEKELVVEYGLADPSPADKTYVDPLRDWEISPVTYYRDSFGRPVYLQLEGASGLVAAGDYRDFFDECDGEEDGGDGERDSTESRDNPEHRAFGILGTKDVLHSGDDPTFRIQFPHDNVDS